jgi:hypothetical protein
MARRVDARRRWLPVGKTAGKVEVGVKHSLDVAKLGSLAIAVDTDMDEVLNVAANAVAASPHAATQPEIMRVTPNRIAEVPTSANMAETTVVSPVDATPHRFRLPEVAQRDGTAAGVQAQTVEPVVAEAATSTQHVAQRKLAATTQARADALPPLAHVKPRQDATRTLKTLIRWLPSASASPIYLGG